MRRHGTMEGEQRLYRYLRWGMGTSSTQFSFGPLEKG